MTPGAFKCPKCDRSFKMAAHLGRHQNTIHGAGARGPRGKKKMKRGPGRPKSRRVGRPRGSRNSAAMTSMGGGDGAIRLLSQMQAYFSDLSAQRASIDAQIMGIENAMSSLGGATPRARSVARRGRPPGRRPGRPAGSGAREGTLKDTIVRVLSQRSAALSPQDIATSVLKAGYKTKTKDLSKAVSNTLPQMNNIKRVGRGMYTV